MCDDDIDLAALGLFKIFQCLEHAFADARRALDLAGVVVALRADDLAVRLEGQQVVAFRIVLGFVARRSHEPCICHAGLAQVAAQQAVLAGVDRTHKDDQRFAVHHEVCKIVVINLIAAGAL